jgi:hypothetical protein
MQRWRGGAMKRFLWTLLVCLMFLAWPAQAQDTPTLSSLDISLWPEFDRPEMLVIYRGAFAPDTPLPVPVEIRIPASVGQPTAVAYVGEGDQRLNQQYTTRQEGDSLVIAFQLATLGFQVEYYDTLPIDSEGRREYDFSYTADYPVESLILGFQEPPTAQAYTLEPPADSVAVAADGLTYHSVEAGPVAQGETKSWLLSYEKADSALTINSLAQEQPTASAAPPAATGNDNSTVLIFLVAFVAVVAVGASAFWLGRRTQPLEKAPSTSRQQKRRGGGRGGQPAQRQPSPSGRRETFFCHQCGAELRLDSDFCHKCGAAVRK